MIAGPAARGSKLEAPPRLVASRFAIIDDDDEDEEEFEEQEVAGETPEEHVVGDEVDHPHEQFEAVMEEPAPEASHSHDAFEDTPADDVTEAHEAVASHKKSLFVDSHEETSGHNGHSSHHETGLLAASLLNGHEDESYLSHLEEAETAVSEPAPVRPTLSELIGPEEPVQHLEAEAASFVPDDEPVQERDAPPEAAPSPAASTRPRPAISPKLAGKPTTPVRELPELIELFADWLPQDPDLKWTFPTVPASEPLPTLELDVEGHVQAFTPVYILKPSQAALKRVRVTAGRPPAVLVTADLTTRLAEMCRERKLSALDLNGRALLRAPGLLVDRPAQPGRTFKYELEPRNIFAGKSARILRTLLTDRTRPWNQKDLAERTGASTGLISRIVHHLLTYGHIEKHGTREFRITDLGGLLDAWRSTDNFHERTRTARFAAPETSPVELAHRVRAWARTQEVRIAFTQHLAASLRHGSAEPQVTAAYVSRLPDAATLQEWEMEPVEEGGDLWLHLPDEEGVFLETQAAYRFVPILQQKINLDLPLASDAQIYLDLLKSPGAGAEQATAMRNWSGFCLE